MLEGPQEERGENEYHLLGEGGADEVPIPTSPPSQATQQVRDTPDCSTSDLQPPMNNAHMKLIQTNCLSSLHLGYFFSYTRTHNQLYH